MSCSITGLGGKSSGASGSADSGMEVSGREGPGTGLGEACPVTGAGSSRLVSTVSSGGLETVAEDLVFLGDLPLVLLPGLVFLGVGEVRSGLRSTLGLSPRDPREGAARLSLFTTFLGGVTPWGERVLFSARLVLLRFFWSSSGPFLLSSSLQSSRSRDVLGGCRGCPRKWMARKCPRRSSKRLLLFYMGQ